LHLLNIVIASIRYSHPLNGHKGITDCQQGVTFNPYYPSHQKHIHLKNKRISLSGIMVVAEYKPINNRKQNTLFNRQASGAVKATFTPPAYRQFFNSSNKFHYL